MPKILFSKEILSDPRKKFCLARKSYLIQEKKHHTKYFVKLSVSKFLSSSFFAIIQLIPKHKQKYFYKCLLIGDIILK